MKYSAVLTKDLSHSLLFPEHVYDATETQHIHHRQWTHTALCVMLPFKHALQNFLKKRDFHVCTIDYPPADIFIMKCNLMDSQKVDSHSYLRQFWPTSVSWWFYQMNLGQPVPPRVLLKLFQKRTARVK